MFGLRIVYFVFVYY